MARNHTNAATIGKFLHAPRTTCGIRFAVFTSVICLLPVVWSCSGGTDADGWGVGEDAGDTGVDGCESVEPPECVGGNLSEVTTDAGCTIQRCYCSDLEAYHEPSGQCVLTVGTRPQGRPCDEHSECDSGYCDKRFLGSEECGICVETCDVSDPDSTCPDGTSCWVPGDVAGYCLPECSCENEFPCGMRSACERVAERCRE